MNIYIWGTGQYACKYLKTGEIKEEDIRGYIESKKSKEYFCGKKVYEPHEVAAINDYDYILALVAEFGREIYNTCILVHIDTNRLVLLNNFEWIDGTCMHVPLSKCCRRILEIGSDVKHQFPVLYKWIESVDLTEYYMVTRKNNFDSVDADALITKDKRFSSLEYQGDYFRFRTFELMANELINQKIEGNVAEFGVFRGTFSALINAKFATRKLYLFDTFESFDPKEFQRELNAGRAYSNMLEVYKDTSVETVMERMPFKEKCVIRKGLFPSTTEGLEDEAYAFVSIDVDFEESILEGLRYFYPRVNMGGMIFLHDFNTPYLGGCKIAVDRYETEIGKSLSKLPLADGGGTLVIIKT